jgi:hypothetical protein
MREINKKALLVKERQCRCDVIVKGKYDSREINKKGLLMKERQCRCDVIVKGKYEIRFILLH